ncbi:MAG: flagellar basal body rod protein FlgB [Lachnospiraceae bacterium]|nr:flagellar basal body rod protein FlgB [Lachnospiraceae bacterium]
MIISDAFGYINMMDRTADASYLRETVIANNIANVDTPTYKRQDVEFSSILKDKLSHYTAEERSLDKAVNKLSVEDTEARKYVDYPNYSYRLDRNNVDIDTENVELASEQQRYSTITTSITNDFQRFNAVIS